MPDSAITADPVAKDGVSGRPNPDPRAGRAAARRALRLEGRDSHARALRGGGASERAGRHESDRPRGFGRGRGRRVRGPILNAGGRGGRSCCPDRLRRRPADASAPGQTGGGRAVFHETGCAACHTPTLGTGTRQVTALLGPAPARRGAGLDDRVVQGLRDWRASGAPRRCGGSRTGSGSSTMAARPTIEAAILAHGGEAQRARERFRALSPQRRRSLLEFLRQLCSRSAGSAERGDLDDGAVISRRPLSETQILRASADTAIPLSRPAPTTPHPGQLDLRDGARSGRPGAAARSCPSRDWRRRGPLRRPASCCWRRPGLATSGTAGARSTGAEN